MCVCVCLCVCVCVRACVRVCVEVAVLAKCVCARGENSHVRKCVET